MPSEATIAVEEPMPVAACERPAAPALATSGETLAQGVAAMLVLAVAQRVIGFGRAMLFCRWLEPDELGLWDLAWGFLLMAAPLAVLSLPGTFGRYCEHFRRRGELRPFVRRTAGLCAGLALTAIALILFARTTLAEGLFGSADYAPLMLAVVAALSATIVYNFLTGLFTALRQARRVAVLDFLNSLLFAVVGVGLMACSSKTAESVVLAWGIACLVCAVAALWWLRPIWADSPEPPRRPSHGSLWRKLAPFAVWIMLINLLTNLFALADRALIVHFAPGDSLALLGQYHSSRVIPMLLVSIAGLLSMMLLPHLSHDWEAGRRNQVSRRLTLFVKLSTFGMTVAATAILLVAPWLFETALAGKYATGLAVLPWTLVLCVWFGASMIVQQYLWCAEKAAYVCAALIAGLALNVALAVVLLPQMGLLGGVLATTAANGLALLLIVELSRRSGYSFDRGLIVVLIAPLSLACGGGVASAMLAIIAALAWRDDHLLSPCERSQMAAAILAVWHRARNLHFAASQRRPRCE